MSWQAKARTRSCFKSSPVDWSEYCPDKLKLGQDPALSPHLLGWSEYCPDKLKLGQDPVLSPHLLGWSEYCPGKLKLGQDHLLCSLQSLPLNYTPHQNPEHQFP